MAPQDADVIAFAGAGGGGTTFSAGPSDHASRRRTEPPGSHTQRDRSLFRSSDSGGHTNSLPCPLSPKGISCWTKLPCSTAIQALLNVSTFLSSLDPTIHQQLQDASDSCKKHQPVLSILKSLEHVVLDTATTHITSSKPEIHSSTSSHTATPDAKPGTSTSRSNQTGTTADISPFQTITSLLTSERTSVSSYTQSFPSGGSDITSDSGSGASELVPSVPTAVPGITLTSAGSSSFTSAASPSPTSLTPSSSLYNPIEGPSHSASPMPPAGPHGPNIGAIVGIVLAAFSVLLCIVLALIFLLRRRMRTRAKRRSSGGPWQRLKPHIYDDASSGAESSLWTWFGSVPVDSDYEPKRGSRPHTPDSQTTSAPGPFSCPSPTPTEGHPSMVAAPFPQTRSLHDGSRYLTVSASSTQSLAAVASSTQLLALAGTEFAVATAADRGGWRPERVASGVSRTTASSGNVDSVEAM